jgi:hypothetical protein
LRESERVCWPPKLGGVVSDDGEVRTPGDPNDILDLVLQVVLDPMPTEKCLLTKCLAPGTQHSRTPMLISFEIQDINVQKSLFKFLRNHKGATVAQIGEMQVDL